MRHYAIAPLPPGLQSISRKGSRQHFPLHHPITIRDICQSVETVKLEIGTITVSLRLETVPYRHFFQPAFHIDQSSNNFFTVDKPGVISAGDLLCLFHRSAQELVPSPTSCISYWTTFPIQTHVVLTTPLSLAKLTREHTLAALQVFGSIIPNHL